MWIEKENWIGKEKEIMDIEKEFFLLEIFRFRIYSLELLVYVGFGVTVCLSLLFHNPFIGIR